MPPENSPLPWTYDGLVIRDANGAVLMDQTKPHGELDANAKLIVMAVNQQGRKSDKALSRR